MYKLILTSALVLLICIKKLAHCHKKEYSVAPVSIAITAI